MAAEYLPLQRDFRSRAHEVKRIKDHRTKWVLGARNGPGRGIDCLKLTPYAPRSSLRTEFRILPSTLALKRRIAPTEMKGQLHELLDGDLDLPDPDDGYTWESYVYGATSGDPISYPPRSSVTISDLLFAEDGSERVTRRVKKQRRRQSEPYLVSRYNGEDSDWDRGFGPRKRWQSVGEWAVRSSEQADGRTWLSQLVDAIRLEWARKGANGAGDQPQGLDWREGEEEKEEEGFVLL